MKKVFYEKVGRRYKPVSEYDSTLQDALPKGTHLISCYPGGQSTRYKIDPNYAALIAAGRVAEDAISKHIMEVSALRTSNNKLTPDQAKAWEQLKKVMGNQRYALEYCSYREAAQAGVKAMMDELEKLMTAPAVKKAFEHFMLVCELTKDEKHESNR